MDIKECYEMLGITKKATDEQVKKHIERNPNNFILIYIDMIKTQLLNLQKYQRRIGLYQKIVKRNISLYLTFVLYSAMP